MDNISEAQTDIMVTSHSDHQVPQLSVSQEPIFTEHNPNDDYGEEIEVKLIWIKKNFLKT